MVNTIRTTERVVNVDELLELASQPTQTVVKAGQTMGSSAVGSGVRRPGQGPGNTISGGTVPSAGRGISVYGQGQTGYYLGAEPSQPEPKEQLDDSFVIGVPYFLPFATMYRDSWEVYRDDIVTIHQLNSMRREDGQARALYRLLTMPIRAALKDSSFQPRDESGQKEADFISDMMTLPPTMGGMEISFNRVVAQMLLSIFEGFSAFEMVYWCPDKGPLKGKWTPRRLEFRPADTLTFLLDGTGTWSGFRQRTFFNGRSIDVKIEAKDCFYVAMNEEERPFYGVSMFETAFFHYDKKVKLYYITHLAAQRSSVGTRIGTMPPNPMKRDKEMFVNGLQQLGLAQYMIVPSSDWTVTNLKEEGSFDFLGLINHHNSQMSKSVLQAWFDDQQGTGGDTTLVDFGKQSDATGIMLLQAIMDDLKWVIDNKIIPKFIDWNFGSENYPEFHWGPLTEEQKAAIQDTFDKLALGGQNLVVSKQFMLELEQKMAAEFGFDDIDYDAQLERLEAQQDAQDKLTDQQNKQALAESKFSVANLNNPQQQMGAPGQAGGAPPQQSGPPSGAGQTAGGQGGSSASSSSASSAGQPPKKPATASMSSVQLTDEQRLEAMDWLLYDILAPA